MFKRTLISIIFWLWMGGWNKIVIIKQKQTAAECSALATKCK